MSTGVFPSGVFPDGIYPTGIFPHKNESYIYPIIEYNEDNEMFQIVGTSKSHPVQIRSLTTGDLVTSVAGSITCTYSLNCGTPTEFIPNPTPVYNNTMLRWIIAVPSTLAATAYDSVEINLSCTEGEGFAMINVVPDPTTTGTTAQQVWEYTTRTTTGGTGTGGNEHVITGYSLNASTKTITITEVGYTTLSIEQIKFIYNLTQGCEIYDRETPRKRMGGTAGIDITINGADITFIEDATMTNNDKLLIVVNV